jgi:hypothetical protein
MFENFEQSEPENNRLALALFLSLVFVPVIFIWVFQFLPGMREDPPQVNHTLETDKTRLIRVNELCTKLPRPEKLEFVSSHENSGFASTVVIYNYTSTRGAEEIMPVFLVWLNENGWSRIPNTSTYEKGKQTVYISPSTFSNSPWTNYEIYCTEKD